MEKDIIVIIRGINDSEEEDSEIVETTCLGTYYCKNNKEYIVYTEYMDQKEGTNPTRSTVRIDSDQVVLSRAGDISGQMVFSLGRNHLVYYETPFGMMEIRILTKKLNIDREEHRMALRIEYEMVINDQPRGMQTVDIQIYDRFCQ